MEIIILILLALIAVNLVPKLTTYVLVVAGLWLTQDTWWPFIRQILAEVTAKA